MCGATEIIFEIKQFKLGLMGSNSFIESNHMYMVYTLSDTDIIEKGHFLIRNKRNG